MKKKIVTLLMAYCISLSITACSGTNDKSWISQYDTYQKENAVSVTRTVESENVTQEEQERTEEHVSEAEQERIEEEKRLAEEKAQQEAEEIRLAQEKAAQAEAQKLAEEKATAEMKAEQQAEAQRLKETEQTTQNTANNNTAPAVSGAPNTPQSSGAGGDSNFNTYNNTEQQNTNTSWVLNTSTLKIHYPSCRSVPKIAPQNYSTSNDSLDTLKNQGYSTCGICFK